MIVVPSAAAPPSTRRSVIVAMAAGLSSAAWPAAAQEPDGLGKWRPVDPPTPAPEIAFEDGEGAKRTLADYRGQVVVLNFWATWCAPCIREMPSLARAQALLRGERVLVLPLSLDRNGRAKVDKFYEEARLEGLGRWIDPTAAAGRAFKLRGLPTTVVLDAAGREAARLEGEAAWDAPAMLARLTALARQS